MDKNIIQYNHEEEKIHDSELQELVRNIENGVAKWGHRILLYLITIAVTTVAVMIQVKRIKNKLNRRRNEQRNSIRVKFTKREKSTKNEEENMTETQETAENRLIRDLEEGVNLERNIQQLIN